MKGNRLFILTAIALVLGFALSWILRDPLPFTTAAGTGLLAKGAENYKHGK